MKLTQKEKRGKIAEACGYKDCHESASWDDAIGTLHDVGGPGYVILPDYFNDLNACHEMEKALPSPAHWISYASFLEKPAEHNGAGFLLHVTAAQRAEAFGLAMGLWKEGE